MKYNIKYSKAAIRDLDNIWEEIYEVSQDITITTNYINNLMDKVEAKSYYPKSGTPLYYENKFTGYYFVVFKKYIAFYRLKNQTIFVDRILYAKSDYIRQILKI